MVTDGGKFWLEDLLSFRSPTGLTESQRLNLVTWLVVIGSLLLYLLGIRAWWLFLLGGLLVIVMQYLWRSPQPVSHYTCRRSNTVTHIKRPDSSLRLRPRVY